MADRYLIENREAAIGVAADVSATCGSARCRGAAVWRAHTQVLLGCQKGLRRAVQRTRRRRSVAGRTPVGLATVGGLLGEDSSRAG
jgi:hypothetical protein